jgi:AcrR family transcriptional regulator
MVDRFRSLPGEGLRERKKRLTRQQISDTATLMFLEHGFDVVRVADIADACGVSEKTVYNYFPTKESLVLDREEATIASVRAALGPGATVGSPIEAIVAILIDELESFYGLTTAGQSADDLMMIHRFRELVDATPSLRTAWRDMMDRIAQVAAEAMAQRAGVDPDDPEPRIAAHALIGLWTVQFRAMQKYTDGKRSAPEISEAVASDVRRAARLLDTGLWSFGMAVQGSNGREQLKQAAETANEARKQVIKALTQARNAWRTMAQEHEHDEHRRAAIAGPPDRRDRHAEARQRQQALRARKQAMRDVQTKRKGTN